MILFEILVIFICVVMVILKEFSGLIFIAILLLFVYYLHRYVKESKNFSFFKKRVLIKEKDLILGAINQIDTYKKIIVNKNNIIVVLKYGIFFIKVFDYTGLITGLFKDKYLLKKELNKEVIIKNDLELYDEEYEFYKNKTNEKIYKYLVVKNNCLFNVKISGDIKIVKSRNIFFEIEKNSSIYNNKDIDYIYDKLVKLCQKSLVLLR